MKNLENENEIIVVEESEESEIENQYNQLYIIVYTVYKITLANNFI